MTDYSPIIPALGPMAGEFRWFLFRLTPDPKKPGHYQKMPCAYDGTPGFDHLSAPDEQMMTFEMCNAWAMHHNANLGQQYPHHCAYVPGYSLRDGCGYWCLDMDDAVVHQPDGSCNFADEHMAWLFENLVTHSGAAWEYSSSGTGIHVFGSGKLPPHAKKNSERRIELYTEGRGMAFGLTPSLSGAIASPVATNVVAQTVIPHYFPFTGGQNGEDLDETDFTTGPQVEYKGPKDDEELIGMMLNSINTKSAFGSGASFEQLWTNAPELSQFYAGESEKDMALIALLAFWTGKDMGRIERLMKRSRLARPKWIERRGKLSWLQFSISVQCQKPMNTYQAPEVLKPSVLETREEGSSIKPVARERQRTDKSYLDIEDQIELFNGCVYIRESNTVWTPVRENYGMLLDQSKFNVEFGGRAFRISNSNDDRSIVKKAWDAFTGNAIVDFPRADRIAFEPSRPPGEIFTRNDETFYNTYQLPTIPMVVPAEGEIEKHLFGLVGKLLPDARDQQILLYYMAAVVQHRGTKFKWCPVLQGAQGNGKSSLAVMLEQAVGQIHTHHVRSSSLTSKFNSWLHGKVLLVVDDVRVERRDKMALEILKPMITSKRIEIEGKGVDHATREVCGNFFLSMNDKSGIPREDNERRYAIFYTNQQCEEDVHRDFPEGYFEELYNWLETEDGYAKVAWWLHNVPIPSAMNPARGCARAPRTSSEVEVRAENTSSSEQIITAAIANEEGGFRGGYVSFGKVREFLAEEGIKATFVGMRKILFKLGYQPHPDLGVAGQTFDKIGAEGNKKVRLWVKPGHHSIGASPSVIARDYEKVNFGQTVPEYADYAPPEV